MLSDVITKKWSHGGVGVMWRLVQYSINCQRPIRFVYSRMWYNTWFASHLFTNVSFKPKNNDRIPKNKDRIYHAIDKKMTTPSEKAPKKRYIASHSLHHLDPSTEISSESPWRNPSTPRSFARQLIRKPMGWNSWETPRKNVDLSKPWFDWARRCFCLNIFCWGTGTGDLIRIYRFNR